MTARVQDLIDKKDTFEIIRDRIAVILAEESASQVAKATADGKDNPEDWELRVYTERANPWAMFQDDSPAEEVDDSPVVNVWYDGSGFDMSKSNISNRQHANGKFNIDIYGYGRSAGIDGGGHTPGDEEASLIAQRGLRLVRNILMSAYYVRLNFDLDKIPQNIIGRRWSESIQSFQPEFGNQNALNVQGIRFVLAVDFNEFSQEFQGENLEKVVVDIKRDVDGKVLATGEYNYT